MSSAAKVGVERTSDAPCSGRDSISRERNGAATVRVGGKWERSRRPAGSGQGKDCNVRKQIVQNERGDV